MTGVVHYRSISEHIEQLALNAWPAFETENHAGWLLRCADGYTKRANSVTVLRPAQTHLEARVAHCEAWYGARRQPPIFRLLSFTQPALLDDALVKRGYRLVEPSLVMHRPLIQMMADGLPRSERLSIADWLWAYHRLREVAGQPEETHRRLLHAIPATAYCAALKQAGATVVCGLGVVDGDGLGLFDIVTASWQRRRGHATALIEGLHRWGQAQGAKFSYLQVVEANAAAVSLYRKLGYRTMYKYWYRVGNGLRI